jgi:hypothetical protein
VEVLLCNTIRFLNTVARRERVILVFRALRGLQSGKVIIVSIKFQAEELCISNIFGNLIYLPLLTRHYMPIYLRGVTPQTMYIPLVESLHCVDM